MRHPVAARDQPKVREPQGPCPVGRPLRDVATQAAVGGQRSVRRKSASDPATESVDANGRLTTCAYVP